MSDLGESTKNNKIRNGIIIGVVVALVVVALVFLLKGNETRVSGGNETKKLSVLDCEASQPTNPFFHNADTITPKHEIKVTFQGDDFDKISYNFFGNYRNNDIADTANASLHASYNNYMGEHKIYPELFYPTFIATDSSVKINLYAEKAKVQPSTGVFFFLSGEDVTNLDNYTKDDLTRIYSSKGFSCTFHE